MTKRSSAGKKGGCRKIWFGAEAMMQTAPGHMPTLRPPSLTGELRDQALSGILAAKQGPARGVNPIGRAGKGSEFMRMMMMALIALLGLAACGGGGREGVQRGGYSPAPLLFAQGPLQQACQSDGRKAASRARCGCVQAVANASLSAGDQRRGASLWKDPARLQEIRQSDAAANERFWAAWKGFAQEAERLCSAT
jgi:hypothetical protein